jgi:hypothetical protein
MVRIEIPVIVNVLYRTAAEIFQMRKFNLNWHFKQGILMLKMLISWCSGYILRVKANVVITFVLEGINEKRRKKLLGTRRYEKTLKGWTRSYLTKYYFYIWACTIGGILGYAQFPGGNSSTDGVVIDSCFGMSGTGPYQLRKNWYTW